MKKYKVKIKNPVLGLPITIIDKIADDGYIRFIHKDEEICYKIIWTTDRGGDGYLENLKIIWERYDAPVVNNKGLYKRILIQKVK